MPSLVDRIWSIFRKASPAEPTTATETQPPSQPTALIEKFRAETDRANVVRKCREMYKTDPRAKKMLRMLARDIVRGGFVVRCDDRAAVDVANDLKKRIDLESRLDDWVRLTARDGDSFIELGINERLEIVDVTRKPTLEMHRNSDRYDRFPDPERAYWWADDFFLATQPPENAVWFADWQIVHARWEHDEGSRYGSPMMAAGTGHFKKVQEGELDISVRRKTRAGMKYLHVVEGASETDLTAYKERNKDALDSPLAAVADFFTNKPGSISVIQGDANLEQIRDVQHHIATWMTSGEVPMELVAYGENLNRDVLQEKKEEYDEALAPLREWLTTEVVKPILETQWLLAGIYPPNLDYTIEWRSQKDPKPADLVALIEAAFRMRMLGIQDEIIAQILSRFLPGVEPEELFAVTPGEPSGSDVERISQALSRLGGGL